jgi:dTDP-4-dehydrorhamnose reductase
MPGKIAKMTSELGIKLIHISTDHLFDGKSKNYTEEAKTMPLNIYSKSKLLGENEVIKNDKNALIIRTNFFGNGPHYKPSFSDRIISTLRQKKNILLFNNVYYTPISIEELASCVLMLINNNLSGIFNVAGNERITKYEFGLKIADLINESKDLVIPIDIEEKKDLTIRPKDMSLSNAKLFKAINPKITPLSNQIIDIINKPKIEINIVQ